MKQSVVFRPREDVTVRGNCNRDSLTATLQVLWDDGAFSLRFAFDDLTDSYYVRTFSFLVNTTRPIYKDAYKSKDLT